VLGRFSRPRPLICLLLLFGRSVQNEVVVHIGLTKIDRDITPHECSRRVLLARLLQLDDATVVNIESYQLEAAI
jgi:hypothetical protein